MTTHRTRPSPRHLAVGLGVCLLLPIVGCGGDDGGAADTTTTAADTATTAAETSGATETAGDTAAAPVIDPGDGGRYQPDLPTEWASVVDNPFLPLVPGTRWVYEGTSDGESERTEVEVLPDTRTVMGIEATVVRDQVSVEGSVVEDTFDWYAQDADGNVWYLGEDSKEVEDGEVVGTEGSWEAGVDGALPGIVMPVDPTVGDAYRQEYDEGEAEDLAEVIAPPASVEVLGRTHTDLVRTREWNPLEPDVVEEKTYVAGIGLVGEVEVEGGDGSTRLVEVTGG